MERVEDVSAEEALQSVGVGADTGVVVEPCGADDGGGRDGGRRRGSRSRGSRGFGGGRGEHGGVEAVEEVERHCGEQRDAEGGEEGEGKEGKSLGDGWSQQRQEFKQPRVRVEVERRPDRVINGPLPRPDARQPEHAQRRLGALVVLVGCERGEGEEGGEECGHFVLFAESKSGWW